MFKSENYALWDSWGKAKRGPMWYNIGGGETHLCTLKLTSAFHPFQSVSLTQLCALAHLGCTCKEGT